MLATISRLIVKTFFREVVIEGSENLSAISSAIFTPNHPNALLDPLLMSFLPSPGRLRFVAKAPLFKMPVFGWLLHWMQAIPVARRLDAAGEIDQTAFFAACVEALAAGDSIVIFPEGRSLPQPTMAPLRTGAARLYFLAREKGIQVSLVPVGLNYERGAIFRSSVLVSVVPPLDTAACVAQYATDPVSAVRHLTAAIMRALEHHVFQVDTFRDRELLLLLERLYAEDEHDHAWPHRLARLKEFAVGLKQLRGSYPHEIERLRHLLARYERLSLTYGVRENTPRDRRGHAVLSALLAGSGMLLASLGWVLNWLPYRLCGTLVRATGHDEAGTATDKIVFALCLFPLAYVSEGILVAQWLGPVATVAFAVCIMPLTYFTLLFFEWHEELGAPPPLPLAWLKRGTASRVAAQLAHVRQRIVAEVEVLAARPELQSEV